jgi:hypothetical protein
MKTPLSTNDPWKITEQDRTMLLRAVSSIVRDRVDPEDALHYAMEIALQKFDPNKPDGGRLISFVMSVAKFYTWNQTYKPPVSLDDPALAGENHKGDHHDPYEFLVGVPDKYPSMEMLNEEALEALAQHVRTARPDRYKRKSRINALILLSQLAYGIESGDTYGVEESKYHQRNLNAWTHTPLYQLHHRNKAVLREFRQNLYNEFGITKRHLEKSQALLREAARRAVREGALD